MKISINIGRVTKKMNPVSELGIAAEKFNNILAIDDADESVSVLLNKLAKYALRMSYFNSIMEKKYGEGGKA